MRDHPQRCSEGRIPLFKFWARPIAGMGEIMHLKHGVQTTSTNLHVTGCVQAHLTNLNIQKEVIELKTVQDTHILKITCGLLNGTNISDLE